MQKTHDALADDGDLLAQASLADVRADAPDTGYGLQLPVHLLHLVEMGMTQGQNFDLEGLSVACADDGAYDFLITATPLPFERGCGGPCAPVAIK